MNQKFKRRHNEMPDPPPGMTIDFQRGVFVPRKPQSFSTLYFVRRGVDGPVKIGVTSNLTQRGPIETAPKDGTVILICFAGQNRRGHPDRGKAIVAFCEDLYGHPPGHPVWHSAETGCQIGHGPSGWLPLPPTD
jgi:hypothetical protein